MKPWKYRSLLYTKTKFLHLWIYILLKLQFFKEQPYAISDWYIIGENAYSISQPLGMIKKRITNYYMHRFRSTFTFWDTSVVNWSNLPCFWNNCSGFREPVGPTNTRTPWFTETALLLRNSSLPIKIWSTVRFVDCAAFPKYLERITHLEQNYFASIIILFPSLLII